MVPSSQQTKLKFEGESNCMRRDGTTTDRHGAHIGIHSQEQPYSEPVSQPQEIEPGRLYFQRLQDSAEK